MTMKKLITFIFLGVFISSCSPKVLPMNVIKNMQKLDLGMSKEQVIEIMGKYYIANSNFVNHEGKSEQTIAYSIDEFDEFRLLFIDNKLMSWDRFKLAPLMDRLPN